MERNSERKIAQKISESLEDKKEVIINELSKCPECIIRPFKQFYNNELSSIRERLDTDMNARLQEQNVSIERQREIAERANRIRTEEIEPLKEKVSDFIASCNF